MMIYRLAGMGAPQMVKLPGKIVIMLSLFSAI